MIIRELIALVLTKMDEKGVQQIESRLFRLRTQIGDSIGRILTDQLLNWGEEAARLEDAKAIMQSTGMSLARLRTETRGLYSDMSLVINYNKAEQFGIGKYFTELANIADAAGKKFGVAQEKALEDLIVGITQGRNARLDNLGIVVDWRKEFDDAARDKGIKRKDLSKLETTAIGMEAAMRMGKRMTDQMEKVGAKQSDVYDQIPVLIGNLRVAIGRLVNSFGIDLIPVIERFITYLTELASKQSVIEFMKDMGTIASLFAKAGAVLASVLGNVFSLITEIPGAAYILTAAFLLFAIPAILELMTVMGGAIGIGTVFAGTLARLTVMGRLLTVGRVALLGFAGSAAAVAGLTTIIAASLDEVNAAVAPEKVSLFEKYSEGFGELREKMFEFYKDDPFNPIINGIAGLTIVYDLLIKIASTITDVLNGIGYMIMGFINLGQWKENAFAPTQGGQWVKDLGEMHDNKLKGYGMWTNEQLLMNKVRDHHDANAYKFLDPKGYDTDSLTQYNPRRSDYVQQPSVNIEIDASNQVLTPVMMRRLVYDAVNEANGQMLHDAQDGIEKK